MDPVRRPKKTLLIAYLLGCFFVPLYIDFLNLGRGGKTTAHEGFKEIIKRIIKFGSTLTKLLVITL